MIYDKIENFPAAMWIRKFFPETSSTANPFIAGGCFKSMFCGQKAKDLDMFFKNKEEMESYKKWLESTGYKVRFENDNVTTLEKDGCESDVELVKKTFEILPEEVIRKFDFTITKFVAYKKDENILVAYHERFFEHLVQKRTVIDDQMPFPVSSFERIIRYARSGFFPCRETKTKIIEAIRASKETDVSKSLYDGWD
jgi:hypothetical protein